MQTVGSTLFNGMLCSPSSPSLHFVLSVHSPLQVPAKFTDLQIDSTISAKQAAHLTTSTGFPGKGSLTLLSELTVGIREPWQLPSFCTVSLSVSPAVYKFSI